MIPQSILSKFFSKFSIRLSPWISQTDLCSWSLWQILDNMDGDQSPSRRQHGAQLDHMECKGWWTLSTKMGWNIYEVLLHAPKMIKQKFQETSTFGMIRHGLREITLENRNLEQFATRSFDFHLGFIAQSSCLLLLPTWFAGVDVAWWENLKTFTIILQRLHLRSEVHSPCTTKNKHMTRFQSMLLIRFLPKVLLLQFYNSKSCCCRLRWNCKKESWWSWYHRFPNPGRVVLCQLGHEQQWKTCHASLPKQRRTFHQACPLLPRQHPRTAAAQPIIIIIITHPIPSVPQQIQVTCRSILMLWLKAEHNLELV